MTENQNTPEAADATSNPIEAFIAQVGEVFATMKNDLGIDTFSMAPLNKDERPLAFVAFTSSPALAEKAVDLWQKADFAVDNERAQKLAGLIASDEAVSFSTALEAVKTSPVRIRRSGWNGKGMYVELQRPDAHSKMTLPYLYLRTAQGDLVPWLASQTDMLSDDWHITLAPAGSGEDD